MSADDQSRVVAAFTSLPAEAQARAGRLKGPRLRALYGLQLARSVALGRVTLDELSAGLDAIGIALSPLQLRNTLTPAATEGLISQRRLGGKTRFSLTQDGEAILELEAGGSLQVLAVVGGRPFTARSDIAAVLREQKGLVRLTDPYYGIRTAELLSELTAAGELRVLTAQCGGGEKPIVAAGALRDLMRQVPTVHVRIVGQAAAIAHDRYLLSADELVLIGHGLKDIGGRDSFVVRLPRQLLGTVAASTEARFDQLWTSATPV